MDHDENVVRLAVAAGVARIEFNRPGALNAIDEPLARAFLDACLAVAARDDVRVVVLSGAGAGFMAGGDVGRMHAAHPRAEVVIDALLDRIEPAVALLTELPVPVVASLHGPVAGAGASIAFAADLAIAADDTRINLAYARIGATPDAGCTWSLPRLVGLRRALEMALLGDSCDAAEALRLGLVNRVVPKAELADATEALARRLADGPTFALGRTKRLMREGLSRGLLEQMGAEREAFREAARTTDFLEGTTAFLAKRAPRFAGR